jgi:type IV pilus assembly protein PilA
MKKNQKGFSLIELLIVVAIILIIAAIAIPNLLRARMAANESSAVGSMRTINTANGNYVTAYNHSFAGSLAALGGATLATPICTQANLIDPVLSATPSVKSGYTFTYTAGTADPSDALCGSVESYSVANQPNQYQTSGVRSFYTDQTGVIRGADNGGALGLATDPALQ